jgi:hypothetical protein
MHLVLEENKMKKLLRVFVVLTVFLGLAFSTGLAQVDPPEVDEELYPGTTIEIEKEVTTPAVPPLVDICLLEDETGSFWDDIAYLQGGTTASDIFDSVTTVSPDAQFAVAGFRDYPIDPYGWDGDWVYRLLRGMSDVKQDWLDGIAALTAGGGNDGPEAQYDAIVASILGGFGYANCGWRADPNVQRVLVVTTDASFHLPGAGKPHVNDYASTLAALNAANVAVIGLTAPGAGGELAALAGDTGGSVQPLSSDGANIANAILAGLAGVTTDVWWTEDCGPALDVSLFPDVHYDVAGETMVTFDETISVPNITQPGVYTCEVTFWSGDYDEGTGDEIGTEAITIEVKPIPIPVDIKPGSCPNPINITKNGVQSVAIVGTEDLDVYTIDPETVALVGVPPLRWAYEDVATPFVPYLGKEDCKLDCTTAGPDGYMDLVFKFETLALVEAIGDCEDGQCLVLSLTGNFFDGRAIMGEDVVWILAKKK